MTEDEEETQDYLLREERIAGLREAAEIAGRFPATYDDGVSLHAENMTCARIRREILARIAELEKQK